MMTGVGVILGHGGLHGAGAGEGASRPTSARDIWAFGAVLYEMLTGRRAFAGDDVSDTLAAVLTQRAGLERAAGRRSPARPDADRNAVSRRIVGNAWPTSPSALFVMTEPALVAAATPHACSLAALALGRPLWRRLVIPTAACDRGRSRGWHRRLARDASERASRRRVLPSRQRVQRRWLLDQ